MKSLKLFIIAVIGMMLPVSVFAVSGNDEAADSMAVASDSIQVLGHVSFADNGMLNMGKVNFGETVTAKTTFTNTGQGPVTIISLVGDCASCTKAVSDKDVIYPGETAEITVTYTAPKYLPTDSFKKAVRMRTDGSDTDTSVLTIYGSYTY